jgi:hypothetical protein
MAAGDGVDALGEGEVDKQEKPTDSGAHKDRISYQLSAISSGAFGAIRRAERGDVADS